MASGFWILASGWLPFLGCASEDEPTPWPWPLPSTCPGGEIDSAVAPEGVALTGVLPLTQRNLFRATVTLPAGRQRVLVWQANFPSDSTLDGVASISLTAGAPGLGLVTPHITSGVDDGARVWTDGEAPEFSAQRALPARDYLSVNFPASSQARAWWMGDKDVLRFELHLLQPLDRATVVDVMVDGKFASEASSIPSAQPRGLTLSPLWVRGAAGQPLAPTRLPCTLDIAAQVWASAGVPLRWHAPGAIDLGEAFSSGVVVDEALAHLTPRLATLLKQSGAATPGSLPVIFVHDLVVQGGQRLYATTGGIPVVPVLGLGSSGIVGNAQAVTDDPVFSGLVLAHEIGHALGLFHTTEGAWKGPQEPIFDQLDDTLACPASADGKGGAQDGQLKRSECRAWGASNLMFWNVGTDGTDLSPEQIAVVNASPLIH